MFKNNSNCTKCCHASVCQYKSILEENCDKISDYWNNLNTPNIFKLELECKEFKAALKSGYNPWD